MRVCSPGKPRGRPLYFPTNSSDPGPPNPILQEVLFSDSLTPAPSLVFSTRVRTLSFQSGPEELGFSPSYLNHESILRQLHSPAESERANALRKPLTFDLRIDMGEH